MGLRSGKAIGGAVCVVTLAFAAAVSAQDQQRQRRHNLPNAPIQQPRANVAPPSPPYAGLAWHLIGPQPTMPLGSTAGTPGATSGRVTAIAIDSTDTTGETVYIGGADGGVWKTTDGGVSWAPLTDSQPTLAIGALAIAPSNHLAIFAGTGVQQWVGRDVYSGVGVLKSLDGGNTWAQTCTGAGNVAGATCPFFGPFSDGSTPGAGARISAIAVNPNNANQLLVAAEIFSGTDMQPGEPGIYCSDDQGATWILLNLHPATAGGATGTAVFYASGSTAFAALGRSGGDPQNGIYVSTNANAACASQTWAPVGGGGLPAQSRLGNIALSYAPNNTNDPGNTNPGGIILYAAIADASVQSQSLAGLYSSANGGAIWVKTSAPDFCTPECALDLVIDVDPADSTGNTIFAGGSNTSNGTLMRSSDGGATWTGIQASSDGTVLRPGQHAVAFAPGGTSSLMYVGSDGGVWSTTGRAQTGSIGWQNLNNGLALTEFYGGLAINPSQPTTAFGGTQGNGLQMYSGTTTWTNLGVCTDGGAAIVDSFSPSTIYVSCANGPNAKLWQSFDAGNTFAAIGSGIATTDPIDPVPPLVGDTMTQGRVYFGTNRLWQSNDSGSTWTAVSGNLASSAGDGVALTSIAVDASNAGVVYTGAEDGSVFVATNVSAGAGTFSNVSSGLPPRQIGRVVVDPSDAAGDTAYVAFEGFASDVSVNGTATDLQGHIFKTTNAGTSWSDISCHTSDCAQPGANDLPNLPVHDLVVDPDDPAHATLYVGTDAGAYVTTNGGASWSVLGTGLPNAAVMSLVLHEPSRTIRAATHGRSVWDLALPSLGGSSAFALTSLSPNSATVGQSSPVALIVTGRGFTPASAVLWNGSSNGVTPAGTPTATSLSVTIAANLFALPGNVQVTVTDPTENPTATNALTFTIIGTAPTITSLTPNSASAEGATGTSDLPIVIAGSNFASNAQATVEGATAGITTGAVNAAGTQVNATVSHLLLQYGGAFFVGVKNPGSNGGAAAQPQLFTVINTIPPPNDNFVNATPIMAAIFSQVVDSSAASVEATDPVPTCSPSGQAAGSTVWWAYASGTGGTVSANTVGSAYDTILAAFTGSPGSFVQVACNHGSTPGTSQVSFTATATTTYYFMVGVANPGAASAHPDLESGGKTVFSLSGPAPVGLTASPTSASVTAGGTASYAISVLSPPFTAQVALTVSGCPTNATCTLQSNTVTAGTSTSLSVVTSAASVASPDVRPLRREIWREAPAFIPFAILSFGATIAIAAITARRRFGSRRPLRTAFCAAALSAFAICICGCGAGDSDPSPPPTTNTGTPAGNYTITITGMANTVSATTSVTLTVN
jgi:hypothetical protein